MLTNVILGVILGVSIFKIGELVLDIISNNRFRTEGSEDSLLDRRD